MIGYTVKCLFQEKCYKRKCDSLLTHLSVHATLLLYTHDTEVGILVCYWKFTATYLWYLLWWL